MKNDIKETLLPSEITRVVITHFGDQIRWYNPFKNTALLTIFSGAGIEIYKAYVTEHCMIPGIEEYITEPYRVEIKDLCTREVRTYNVS